MARTFDEARRDLEADVDTRRAIEADIASIWRRYNRPWWKLVRVCDRITGRELRRG